MARLTGKTTSTTRCGIAAIVAEWERGQLNRRSLLRRAAMMGVGSAALATLVGRESTGRVSAAVLRTMQDDPAAGVRGGTLRVATIGEPPNLDEHQSTAELVALLGYCAYEGLFTYDAEYQPIPELVATHTVSEDGLTHTMALRQGVMFHNGEELKAADAIASLERWGRISGVGKRLFEKTSELAQVDDYTLEFRLSEPYGTILIALAHNTQACTIHPKSILDAAGDDPITDPEQYVGTGPYRVVEWRRDAAMVFERFDGYKSSSEDGPNGYGGTKYAYVDAIEFIPVPDEAARVAGLQAGDYHIGDQIGNDQYTVLQDFPGVVAEILTPDNWDVFFLNWQAPMMGNLAMRQAVQAAFDHTPMLQSGRGGDEFIQLDPSLMMPQTPWNSNAGEEHYNVNNPDLAREKLQEAGYDGEPLRFMTTQEYSYMYGEAIVAQQQLEAVGITVDLQVIDWATLLERRAKPEEWDMFGTGHGFVPDPSQISYVGQMNQYPGWWSSESSLELAAELLAESEVETRMPIFEQIQEAHYTEIPAIKIGDSSDVFFRSDKLGGWDGQQERGYKFWNFWLNES
jgi:peptide/nickel transport system substrate-binding protein